MHISLFANGRKPSLFSSRRVLDCLCMEVIDILLETSVFQCLSCFPGYLSYSEAKLLSGSATLEASERGTRIIWGHFLLVLLCSPQQKVEKILCKSGSKNYINTKELLRMIDFNNFSPIIKDSRTCGHVLACDWQRKCKPQFLISAMLKNILKTSSRLTTSLLPKGLEVEWKTITLRVSFT